MNSQDADFPKKNVAFEVARSTALGALMGAGISLVLTQILGPHSQRSRLHDAVETAIWFGAIDGAITCIRSRHYNEAMDHARRMQNHAERLKAEAPAQPGHSLG